MMGSQGGDKSSERTSKESDETGRTSKESDDNEDKCCFVITVGRDGQIEISSQNQDANPQSSKQSQNRICIGNCPLKVKPIKSKKQSFSIAMLKDDSTETDDPHQHSAEDQAAKSLDQTNLNIQSLDELQRAGVPPQFVKICNKDLANRPSFVVLEDASTRNRIKQNLGLPDLDQSAQQQASPLEINSHSGCQTDEMCSQRAGASSNNSCNKVNAVPTIRNLSQPMATKVRHKLPSSSTKQAPFIGETRREAENVHSFSTQAQLEQQHQQCQSTSSHAPYVTISLVPFPQTGAGCGTSVIPCQQFLSAAPSNTSCCSCCTSSNCCLPRPPHVCQVPTTTNDCRQCCSPGLPVSQNLGCCLLAPNCSCSRCISCCPVSSKQHQSSLGFAGHYKTVGMPVSNQMSHHVFPPDLPTTSFALGGGFHPGISPCLCQLMCTCSPCSHCRMNAHHCPHCHCAGFCNNQQQYQLQQPQMGQVAQQEPQAQCDCCSGSCSLKQRPHYLPNKAKGLEGSEKEETNQDGLKHVFCKVPQVSPKATTQPLSEDQEQQQQTAKSKSTKETPRSFGGASNINSDSNGTSLYVARFGRTYLILRPTATAMVPRLLTKRISRYTSVVVAPR